jgi:hypothetical protein
MPAGLCRPGDVTQRLFALSKLEERKLEERGAPHCRGVRFIGEDDAEREPPSELLLSWQRRICVIGVFSLLVLALAFSHKTFQDIILGVALFAAASALGEPA